MNGAETLADTLLASGVTVCFANPGTSEMQLVAAIDRQHRMRAILGSGLIDQSQKMMVAARATAEKKAFGHRS